MAVHADAEQSYSTTEAQWHMAVDAMPQLVCLLDGEGRLVSANRTLERWGLGDPEGLRGMHIHELLHRNCTEADCYLGRLWQCSKPQLDAHQRWGSDTWDALLGKHLRISVQQPAQENSSVAPQGFFAVATFSDMSEWVRTEEALKITQSQVWRLSAQHLTIQESERRRIAADLHDGLGQTLSLVKLSIEEAARSSRNGSSSMVAATLESLAPTVKLALVELRRISMNLRPSTLDDLGIVATLSWYFREFEAACPSVKVERDISVAEAEVPDLLKIAIFRIVQEATSNALKHARSERIKVGLHSREGALELFIEDNGQGFDTGSAGTDFSHGLGLQSMRERAELSGGAYAIDSAPGKGTCIRVRWAPEHSLNLDWASLPEAATQARPIDRHLSERFSQCAACLRRHAAG